jgi:hypothetical protein
MFSKKPYHSRNSVVHNLKAIITANITCSSADEVEATE